MTKDLSDSAAGMSNSEVPHLDTLQISDLPLTPTSVFEDAEHVFGEWPCPSCNATGYVDEICVCEHCRGRGSHYY